MNNIFVTIGSTSFDRLFDELLSTETLNILYDLGCKKLILQHGNYSNKTKLNSIKESWKKFEIINFDYVPSIESFINNADFVIGHAGAGTILETLRHHKPMLIVVNDTLMNNHQQELALEMSSLNYAFMTSSNDLTNALKNIKTDNLIPFPERKPELFGNFMRSLLIEK